MTKMIVARVQRAFELTYDLFAFLAPASLVLRIPHAPSNTLGEQAWCIIGGRESFLAALKAGSWQGFRCSLEGCSSKPPILDKLRETALDLTEFCSLAPHNLSPDLLLDLLEHEVQHHGQLIRYVYANRLSFPPSWSQRYTV